MWYQVLQLSQHIALFFVVTAFWHVPLCKYSLYEQNGRSKLFNLDFVWVTLEYGLCFLNCYEWCKFPFTQCSTLSTWIFTHVNNGITVGMWGKTHCFDVQCKLSRNSMHLSHSVNRVDSQLQPELGYMHPPFLSQSQVSESALKRQFVSEDMIWLFGYPV
jgi:hypothetical protein